MTITPGAYAVIAGRSEVIRASGFDWTLARVLLLNDKPKTGNVRVGYPGKDKLGSNVSRADLADFMLK